MDPNPRGPTSSLPRTAIIVEVHGKVVQCIDLLAEGFPEVLDEFTDAYHAKFLIVAVADWYGIPLHLDLLSKVRASIGGNYFFRVLLDPGTQERTSMTIRGWIRGRERNPPAAPASLAEALE